MHVAWHVGAWYEDEGRGSLECILQCVAGQGGMGGSTAAVVVHKLDRCGVDICT
jgi:hypothetical protein